MRFLFNFYINTFFVGLSNSFIFLPFQIKYNLKGEILSYDFYSKINIGSPPQIVDTKISFEIPDYFLISKSNETNFGYNKSLSFSFDKALDINASNSEYSNGYWASDNFYFYNDIECKSKIIIESFPIILPQIDDKLLTLKIGLQILNINDTLNNNIVYNMKAKNLIYNLIWTIKFKNINEGQIIFGGEPQQYEKYNNIYNKKNFEYINTISENNKLYWGLNFNYIKISNLITDKNIKGKIVPTIPGIISTYEFLLEMENFYFKQYENEKICSRSNINIDNNNYIKIICLKEKLKENDIQQFPILNFFNSELNYTFNFDGKELFFEEKEYISFQIFFKAGLSEDEWLLGRLFIMKYQIVFNNEKKINRFL